MYKVFLKIGIVVFIFVLLSAGLSASEGLDNGQICQADQDCRSGRCSTNPNICCPQGETCCLINSWCQQQLGSEYSCGSDFYCLRLQEQPDNNDSSVAAEPNNGPGCQYDNQCLDNQWCNTAEEVCFAKLALGQPCDRDRICQSGICFNNSCAENRPYCGNDQCEAGEDCRLCPNDCGICLQAIGQACYENRDCQSNICYQGKCQAETFSWCGDGICQTEEACDCHDCFEEALCQPAENGEDCEKNADCASNYCLEKICVKAELLDEYYQEYFELTNPIGKLDTKIYLAPLKQSFSASEMHGAIMTLILNEYQEPEDQGRAVALLKALIAVEKTGLSLYQSQNEIAHLLAQNTWSSVQIHLLAKIKGMLGQHLEDLNKLEITVGKDAINDLIKQTDKSQSESLGNFLKKIGLNETEEFISLAEELYNQSDNNPREYLRLLDQNFKDKYIEAYKKSFKEDFQQILAKQIVMLQAGLWQYDQAGGVLENSDQLYKAGQDRLVEIEALANRAKAFINAKSNFFQLVYGFNQQLILATKDLSRLLDKGNAIIVIGSRNSVWPLNGEAAQTYISLIQDYNNNLNSALSVAADSAESATVFTESYFGPYSTATATNLIEQTYKEWCGLTLSQCERFLLSLEPENDFDNNFEQKNRFMSELIPNIATNSAILSQRLSDFEKNWNGTIFQEFQSIAKFIRTQISSEIVKIKKFVFDENFSNTDATGKLVAFCRFNDQPAQKRGLIPLAKAASKDDPEFNLISPSGKKYGSAFEAEMNGFLISINNPEQGEWQSEIISRQTAGLKEAEVLINDIEFLPGEQSLSVQQYQAEQKIFGNQQNNDFNKRHLIYFAGVFLFTCLGLLGGLVLANFLNKKKG